MTNEMDLEKIFSAIEQARNNTNYDSELDWKDYNFGENFYRNVSRNQAQTEQESAFIKEKMRLKAGAKILDLGCGGGRNAIALAQSGYQVTGIDLNKYAVEQAEINSPPELKLKFIHQDILEINYSGEYHAVILIFNHFASFNRFQVKKLLSLISNALTTEGKLLIEIPSVSHGRAIDGMQEWQIRESWLSGNFKQLVLSENSFDEKSHTHRRTDFCLRLSDGELFKYTQTSYLYEPEDINEMFKIFGLKLIRTLGGWDGRPYDENEEQLIIIGQK